MDNEFTRMMDGNESAAWGAKVCRAQVIPAYPITPQTDLISHIATLIAEGHMKAEYLKVEGEHTVMAAAIGASAAGARVFTASSSQGLAFMAEGIWQPTGKRLPIVMCMVNRTMGPFGGLQADHTDSFMHRDTGWIQLYCDDSQEVLDTIIMAYKIAENRNIYLPVAVCYDGYTVSATAVPTTVPDQNKVDEFLTPYKHEMYSLMPESFHIPPRTDFWKMRYAVEQAQQKAKHVIINVDMEFGEIFGRSYGGMIEEYHCEDVDAVLVTMGSMTGTGKDVIDRLQEEGNRIGLIKIKSFRPFPMEQFREIGEKYKAMGIVERNNSFGCPYGGIVSMEIARATYDLSERPVLVNFHVGLSGADITMRHFEYMAEKTLKAARNGRPDEPDEWLHLIQEVN